MLLSLITLLTATPVGSQDSTPCLFDTAAHTIIDTVTVGLLAAVPKGQPVQMRHDYLLAAQTIQNFFQRPAQLRLPFWARTVQVRGQGPSITGLYGYVQFRLDQLGRLADTEIHVDMSSPDVAESIVAAVRRADSANAFLSPSRDILHDHGIIRLRFGIVPDTGRQSIPMLRLVVPMIVIDSVPTMISFPQLGYPVALRAAGVGDNVLLQFVVLPDGHIDPGSLDLLQAGYREFAVAAIDGVRRARFRPARIGACAVPTVVSMPVSFKVRGW